ncbi:thioredoxin family protein [Thalassobellus citreus]|uniref:thioredoxin family protein n=1 Tax=Thalassobellus citreus TaxID=3367752 RepID=UPI003795B5DD
MKKILLILIILLVNIQKVSADNWMTSFEEAKKIALATDKFLLVDFWASWCGPCKKMDYDSWSKEDVRLLMANFVPVKIDIDLNRDLALKYEVKGIPFVFIMDGNGKVLHKEMNYKSKNQVLNLLGKYSISTNYLKQYLINYYKNPSFATAFQLASKYSDFTIYLNENIRRDVLNLSNEYFKVSQKALKSSELVNKDVFKQKIKMYEIQEALILNKFIKANKLLDKIKENSLSPKNKVYYYFLKYITFKEMKDETQAIIYKEKLSNNYKLKAEFFLKAISS